jgi:hypothetical protein
VRWVPRRSRRIWRSARSARSPGPSIGPVGVGPDRTKRPPSRRSTVRDAATRRCFGVAGSASSRRRTRRDSLSSNACGAMPPPTSALPRSLQGRTPSDRRSRAPSFPLDPSSVLEVVRRRGRRRSRQDALEGPARRRARPAEDPRPRRGRGGQLPPDGGPEGRVGTRGGPGRTHPRGGPGGARDRRANRSSAARAAGRRAVATSVLRPARDVARPRSRMGDRGSREVSVRRERGPIATAPCGYR